jgi:hypothetical protein
MMKPITKMQTCKPAVAILLFCGILASSSGCHIVGIPSYRADSQAALGQSCLAEEEACPIGVLPPALPLPGWLAKWKAEQDLPTPPSYPRFHPLPTRPMFSRPATSPSGYFNSQPSLNGYEEFGESQAVGASPAYGVLPESVAW